MSVRAFSRFGIWATLAAVAIPACSSENPSDPTLSIASAAKTVPVSPTNYIVLYKNNVPKSAASDIAAAGGTVVAIYKEIGVVIASSLTTTFDADVASKPEVSSAAGLKSRGSRVKEITRRPERKLPPPPPPVPSGEPLANLQWDMDQIHASQARAITPGSNKVVVGVLDSGIDDTVLDLQGQVDHSLSASCVGGAANSDPAVWSHDDLGHGTHVAGIIGAKQNGVGLVGVAPGVRLAAVQVANLATGGNVYADALICAVYWGATHGFDLANASLFTDPWYYACPSDPIEGTILAAEQRAINFAKSKGLTIIASAGNEQQDLGHKTVDPFSPTDGSTPLAHPPTVTNACKLMPIDLTNVIGVSAVGATGNLAYYSNYGTGSIDVAAPGGDRSNGPLGNPGGQIVSDIPAYSYYYQQAIAWGGRVGIGPNCGDLNNPAYFQTVDADGGVVMLHQDQDPTSPTYNPANCPQTYAMLQGTSMAAPHATGVAALALSRFGKMETEDLANLLAKKAIEKACPPNPYTPVEGVPETCTGNAEYNNFYGNGEVDAYNTIR